MLFLCEGETVKRPATKSIYSEDLVISTNVAVIATNKSSIKHRGPYNASDDRETEMVAAPSIFSTETKKQSTHSS